MEGIQVSVEKVGAQNHISVIKVGGYIDTTTSAELERSLDSLLKAGSYNIIVDLGEVDYISSAGWGIFISEIKGIREKGGDLKLVRMIPEVYEVFELLEFHYILKAFDTIEEAIEDFDRDLKAKGGAGKNLRIETLEEKGSEEREIPPQNLEEKIKKIVIENPDFSILKIKKELNTERFGFTKASWFSVWSCLKKLGLDTKRKRIEYFKAHSLK